MPAEKASSFLKSQELKGSVASVRQPSRRLTTVTYRSIINIPKTRRIVQDPSDPQRRLVLFRVPEFGLFLFHSGIGCELMNRFKQADLNEPAQKFLKYHDVATTTQDINLDYDFWNAGETISTSGTRTDECADGRARDR